MADSDTSNSEETTKRDVQDYTDEEIEKLLDTTISSGYSTSEIEEIISKAEAVHTGVTDDISDRMPKHNNSSERIYDYKTQSWKIPRYYFEVNGQPLAVDLGMDVEPKSTINETPVYNGFKSSEVTAVNHLFFQGVAGYDINLKAFVKSDDLYIGDKVGDLNYESSTTVASVLMDWFRTYQVCEVVTSSPIVENGYYRLETCHPKHVYPSLYEFDLKFKQDTYEYPTRLQTNTSISDVNTVIVSGTGSNGYYEGTISKKNIPVVYKTNTGGSGVESTLVKQVKQCGNVSKTCKCTTKKLSSCNVKYNSCAYYLQQALRERGYYLNGKLDGLFCYITWGAVKQYQKDNGLEVTGTLNAATKEKLLTQIS